MRILQLGPRCNNACIFSANALDRTAPAVATREWMERLAALVPTEELGVMGGEPTLREDLFDIVRHAKRLGVGRIVLRTNARRFTYVSYAQQLASAGVSGLDVGLYGSSPAMHDYHTDVPGSFLQTLRGIKHATAVGMNVITTCVVTRSNYRHLVDIARLAGSLGAQGVRFRAPEVIGRAAATRSRIVAPPELAMVHLRRVRAQAQRSGLDVSIDRALTVAVDGSSGVQAVDMDRTAKAWPARQEQRSRERRSGDELRDILPSLFDSSEDES